VPTSSPKISAGFERRFDDTGKEIASFTSRYRFEEVKTVLTKCHTSRDKRVRDKNQQVRSFDSWDSKRKLFVPSHQRHEESFENTIPCVLHVERVSSTPTAIIDPYLSGFSRLRISSKAYIDQYEYGKWAMKPKSKLIQTLSAL
jgi:hypothetical protein